MQPCPLCGSFGKELFTGFWRCPQDKLVYYPQAQAAVYDVDYFEVEYRQQYGHSYAEDKPNIQRRMHHRLQKFLKLHGPVKPTERLLEIGSAHGYFLELAAQAGFQVEGWEISSTAAQIANQAGWLTRTGNFFTLYQDWQQKQEPSFQVLAAFYTIEHFANQSNFWQAAQNLVAKGGWLLLALPSVAGPMFYFHPQKWAADHPIDHFVDYSPKSLRKIAARYGFHLVYTSAEGIHPDRFPGGKWPGVRQFWKLVQQITCFSDTFYGILRKSI